MIPSIKWHGVAADDESLRMRVHSAGGVVWLSSAALDGLGWLRNGVSTRLGGVSTGCAGAMNFRANDFDTLSNVLENVRIFADAVGIDAGGFIGLEQVHGDKVSIVEAGHLEGAPGPVLCDAAFADCDALATDVPGAVIVAYGADCPAISVADPAHRAIGIAHAGWKGTVAGVAARLLEAMGARYGTEPSDVYAAIGPSICKDCYEVGPEVAEGFLAAFGQDGFDAICSPNERGRFQLDLWEANAVVLERAGVPSGRVSKPWVCTCCNPDFLFSHRASRGRRGGHAAFLSIV